MLKVNAMVLRVKRPDVVTTELTESYSGYWQVLVAYCTSRKGILIVESDPPNVGDMLDDGQVVWIKEDDGYIGREWSHGVKKTRWIVGVKSSVNKMTKKKWVFTKDLPAVGEWREVCFI